jgi:uncharacterized membrane protein YeaQ/YmgE (transglycosylase-associated protein family)
MNIVPWYVNVCFSLPFLLVGVVAGLVVASAMGVLRRVVAIAGTVGAVAGEWLGLTFMPRLNHSPWPTALVSSLAASVALSLAAAWIVKRL